MGFTTMRSMFVLKPSHESGVQSKIESPPLDSIAPLLPTTNASRDVELESEAAQDGRIREIVRDNVDTEPLNIRREETSEQLVAALKAENEELEGTIYREQMQTLHLEKELAEAESRNTELTKELQSVRGQLAAEQSRCFKLELPRVLGGTHAYPESGAHSAGQGAMGVRVPSIDGHLSASPLDVRLCLCCSSSLQV